MKVTRFDRTRDLIIVAAQVTGPRGACARVEMALDTGASVTVIVPSALDRLGYSARDGEALTKVRSAIGEEPGYLIRVSRFRTLGHESNFLVHAHDLPEGFEIDGLIGLNLLRRFNYEVRSGEGRILLERLLGRSR